jgi:hypothetical protein
MGALYLMAGLTAVGTVAQPLYPQEPQDAVIRLRLSGEVTGDKADLPFPGLEVRLEAARLQKASSGVTITIILSNRGPKPIALLNVDDLVFLDLEDATGRPLDVPLPPARLLGHYPRVQGRPDASRQVTTINPGDDYRFLSKTPQVFAETPDRQARQRVPIPPGQYSAKVWLRLSGVHNRPDGHPDTRKFWSEPFRITLTPD